MRILRLTKHRRTCLQQMLKDLFYEFDRVKLRRNGIVIFQRNKWKFWERETVHASELLIKEIPIRIEKLSSKFNSKSYPYWKPKKVQNEIFRIINKNQQIDVIEYLWREYTKIKFPVNKMKVSEALITQYSHVKDGSVSLRNVYHRYCNSLIRSPRLSFDDILSQIKTFYKQKEKKVIKPNLKRIQNIDYLFPRRLLAA